MHTKIHSGITIFVIILSITGIIMESCSPLCHWMSWYEWSECTGQCNSGIRNRSRPICCPTDNFTTREECIVGCERQNDTILNDEAGECPTTCVNGNMTTSCLCYSGFAGTCCENELDECDSNPCQNGGTCLDYVNRFECECAAGFHGDFCDRDVCQPLPAEVIFVLDSSISQTKSEFQKQLDVVSNFVDHVTIGPDNIQVAVITFSTNARIEFSLGNHSDAASLKDAVSKVEFKPGATYTNKGLELVKDVFDADEGCKRRRDNGQSAYSYVFLLTDGMSNNRTRTKTVAAEIRNLVCRVIVIGIGRQVSHKELLDIASPGDHVSPQYVFSVENFDSLYTVVKQLVDLTCDECTTSTKSDIVFLLDGSSYITATDWETSINGVTYLIENFDALDDTDGQRISIRTFGSEIQTKIPFDTGYSEQKLLADIQRMSKPQGSCGNNNCNVNITEAVNDSTELFQSENLGRVDARGFVVLFTNGNFDYSVKELDQIVNGTLLVVGVGDEINMDNLLALTADPSLVFVTSYEIEPTVLDAIQATFKYSVCNSDD